MLQHFLLRGLMYKLGSSENYTFYVLHTAILLRASADIIVVYVRQRAIWGRKSFPDDCLPCNSIMYTHIKYMYAE